MVTRSRVRECTPGGLGRCTVAALAEAHKVINRPRAKTDRIVLAPFNLPSEPIGSSRTGYQLIMCARATTAPTCSGFTIDQIGGIMRHVRTTRPTKITFAEMRTAGVRGVLIYCSDYKCSHSTAVNADQ